MRIPGLATMVRWITDQVRTETAAAIEDGLSLGVADVFERYTGGQLAIDIVDETPPVSIVVKKKTAKAKPGRPKRGKAKAT